MLAIIDDKVQNSDAPDAVKSPALSDAYTAATSIPIDLGSSFPVNAIGVGYTDATEITVVATGLNETIVFTETGNKINGLYELPQTTNQVFTVSHNGTYIGRIALGLSRQLGAAPTREPGFYTTQVKRITESGQIIPGAGGYNGRRIALDFRYKIDRDIFDDIETAFPFIARGFPWFLKFSEKELKRLPFERLYASPDDSQILLQSSVNRFLYSKQFDFKERF